MTLTPIETLLVLLAGFIIGMVFFGGLRWTIQRLPETRHPLALAMASLIIRASFVVVALLLVGQSEWQRYVVLMIGIILARILAVRLWGRQRMPGASPNEPEGE